MVVLICTIRYIFVIQPWDLSSNIFTGVSCVFVRLVFTDFIKEWLDKLSLDFQLGKILWGRHYLGGDENSNTVFKNTEIKIKDKCYMVDNNNGESPNTQSSSNNTLPNQQNLPGQRVLPTNTFRTSKGEELDVSGDWRLNRKYHKDYNYDFNYAYPIYRRLPVEKIMSDYDTLITVLPEANTTRPHNLFTDSSLCALKMATQYEGILSANSKSLLKGFGHNGPLSIVSDDKPRALTSQQRKDICNELTRGRAIMLNNLSNVPR